MHSLNPFDYSLSELRKALFAGIPLAFVLLSYIVGWVPPIGFETAVIGLVGPTFALVGVFLATNHSPADLRKALEAMTGAIVTVATYWTTVPASWDNKIALGITMVVSIIGVYWSWNEPPPPEPGS